ncbi:MAG: S41 family peptidase, partial [Gemmataceae bacterium]
GLVTAEEQRRAVGLDYESLGVGLELRASANPGPIEVEGVMFGGPAQRAGMRPGDRITRVNGVAAEKLTPELTLALANERVRVGPALLGSDEPPAAELPRVLRVRYRRGAEQEERATLLYRDRFRPETVLGVVRNSGNAWTYLLDGKARVAHVRLTNLSRGTADELRGVLERLADENVRGLVLDLRWCPGGYLNEAVDVADLFVGDAVIATVKMRGREDTVHRGGNRAAFPDLPVVVLVNAETSGGAELIAAALQDHGRAAVCGQRTKGKASVQTPLSVGLDGVGFKVTSGTFLRPSGKNLHRAPDSPPRDDWGVVPAEDCRVSPDLSRRYAEEWARWSLRPTGSVERLALDDPGYDTQRACAVRLVSKKVDAPGVGK